MLRHVRQHHSDIQVVVLSAFNWPSMRKRHMDAGAIAYFDKGTEFSQARDCVVALSSARFINASPRKQLTPRPAPRQAATVGLGSGSGVAADLWHCAFAGARVPCP